MTDITTISGDPEVLRISDTNNEDPLLSSQRDEEKTMLAVDPCGVAPTTPRMEQAPPQPPVLVVSDPDAAAGPPLPPPPPPLPLPPPPVVPPVTASSSSISPPPTPKPVVSSSKKSRPPYKYDPEKITLRFLFANRDGLTVTVECNPGDTISEVKGALLSVWPEGKLNKMLYCRFVGKSHGRRRTDGSSRTLSLAVHGVAVSAGTRYFSRSIVDAKLPRSCWTFSHVIRCLILPLFCLCWDVCRLTGLFRWRPVTVDLYGKGDSHARYTHVGGFASACF